MKILKPCPFCTSHEIKLDEIDKNTIQIKCLSCYVKLEGKHLKMSRKWLTDKLVDQWNKRILYGDEDPVGNYGRRDTNEQLNKEGE